ncbi:MAG: serine/threonine-protein phosphatase [Lachnospiraceae bacterium]|nr:serine/threonine-protein phosphatase [Lachnospiraceae bacterium]
MNYESDVYWNRGVSHTINQDSLILLQALTSQGRVLMAVICDGMGGMDMGECASGYLVEELVTWFYDGLLDAIGKKKALWIIRRCMERRIYQIQSRMQHYADKRSIEMGTTLSMLVLWEKKYMLWHLGDSRVYRLSSGLIGKGIPGKESQSKVRLLTNDHADDKGRLYKCVGNFGYFVPDFKMGNIKKGEAFLLCSDGFRNKMGIDEIGEVLAPENMTEDKIRKRLREIGEAVLRRGERDDLSAVYIKVCK